MKLFAKIANKKKHLNFSRRSKQLKEELEGDLLHMTCSSDRGVGLVRKIGEMVAPWTFLHRTCYFKY